ncbi:fused N-acetylglucosamine-1-phosphate uridyltransferase and glucosamine-1-phosphate acetyltransferase [Rhodovastum atsumiense]|uniref:Bifunctional protein GlmU n=1 Tax=Rhodovastum atsumiense TaxID=504468 RepID=A0A5M6INF0_9PROT|nr:bifunctional UDP-N-acetylglucosamine diphosphorylase/glucosamine-1-phosphate N-acetyltransferase GlmU [Rhodovastum atsumiense]KAA5609790.1 bifunctional UDP-N-acetylglucosamine diphosphorylase/glucosamine-1-phosphate N-acetyltransferase GlmU [Rhodovastum atsumiense]CAH2599427.1 fused N-acetylglucosamine-1-phosphate uridyltransferase and glucosamine-1-phosphate acetyltransferase [Rhodovastum atsumiense]
MNSATAVLLAAGLGTRMKSALPKALHPIAGRPMLCHLIDSCATVFDRIVVVVGPEMEALAKVAAPHPVVVQQERLGTAHAARQAAALFGDGDVAVLYADNPLITPATLQRLRDRRAAGDAGLALLAMRPQDPGRYGRVIGRDGFVDRIVEWADASPEERSVGLCNAGVLCADAARMRGWLDAVRNDNAKGEYYLTDVVALARAEGALVAAVEAPEAELRGINSRAELAEAEAVVQARLRVAAMEAGVTLTDPASVFFCADTRLAADVTIGPNVVFGRGVTVEAGAEIRAFSHLEGCHVGPGAEIGPFARLRPGTVVRARARVGNFVELKGTLLGEGAKANHLSYLGDAEIGAGSNIGAGTITCNYDGFGKYRTVIGEGAFVGSDSILVAPVTIGNGALISAGSVITQDVSADAMAFGRAPQVEKPGRAAAFRARHKQAKS